MAMMETAEALSSRSVEAASSSSSSNSSSSIARNSGMGRGRGGSIGEERSALVEIGVTAISVNDEELVVSTDSLLLNGTKRPIGCRR